MKSQNGLTEVLAAYASQAAAFFDRTVSGTYTFDANYVNDMLAAQKRYEMVKVVGKWLHEQHEYQGFPNAFAKSIMDDLGPEYVSAILDDYRIYTATRAFYMPEVTAKLILESDPLP